MFSLLLSNEKLHFETNSELIIPRVKSRELYSVTQLLVPRKSKKINVSLTLNVEFDWKANFHPKILFSMEKTPFCGWPTLV